MFEHQIIIHKGNNMYTLLQNDNKQWEVKHIDGHLYKTFDYYYQGVEFILILGN